MTDKPDLTRIWAVDAPGVNVVDPSTTTPDKFADGWTAEVPPFEHFNFIQKFQTQGLAHINEQGIAVWDSITLYPIGGLAKGSDGNVYKALTSQSANDPVTDNGANWVDWEVSNRVIRLATIASPTATFLIPTDYPDLQAAVDDLSDKYGSANSSVIDINIEAGHALTKGLRCANGSFNSLRITSDDAVVYLAAGFSPAVKQSTDRLNTSGYTGTFMFMGHNATMPELSCLIDMEKFVADGMNLGSASSAFIDHGCGVQNAGERGLICWSSSNVAARGSIWSGANDEGVRVQGACSADLRNAVINDCMLEPTFGVSSLYISRSSTVEFRSGSATGSGSSAVDVRRSILTATGADLSNANQNPFLSGKTRGDACLTAESVSIVECTGSILTGGLRGLWVANGATVYIGGATATGNSSFDIYMASGAKIIGSPTTTNGSGGTDLSDVTFPDSDSPPAFNMYSRSGVFINTAAPDFIETGSNSDGSWTRFSDGRQVTVSVDFETTISSLAAGSASSSISPPTLPNSFVSVEKVELDVYGRRSAASTRVGLQVLARERANEEYRVINTGYDIGSAPFTVDDGSVPVTLVYCVQTVIGRWK